MSRPPVDELPLFRWRPPEKLVIFPSARNRAKILRTAIAAAGSKNPDNTIRATLDRARSSFGKKGLPLDLIRRDVAELEAALRAEVLHLQSKRGAAK